ncbi:hypothetical protein EDB80DRAFT_717305 [Ilyonectria destructans]|nr:hypothetical protein EDB80DRAFT_717305 [Ilyonectria destructans]
MLKTYIVVLLLYRPKRAGLLTFLLCYCDRQDATALVFGETKGVLSRNPAVRRFFVGRASTSSASSVCSAARRSISSKPLFRFNSCFAPSESLKCKSFKALASFLSSSLCLDLSSIASSLASISSCIFTTSSLNFICSFSSFSRPAAVLSCTSRSVNVRASSTSWSSSARLVCLAWRLAS